MNYETKARKRKGVNMNTGAHDREGRGKEQGLLWDEGERGKYTPQGHHSRGRMVS